MTAGPDTYRQWWGFVRTNSEVELHAYRDGAEVRAACSARGVTHVRGPFIATKNAAMGILKAKLAVAKARATAVALFASEPQKLLTHDIG